MALDPFGSLLSKYEPKLDTKLLREFRDWAPSMAFPTPELLTRLSRGPRGPQDDISRQLPPEIIERTFFFLDSSHLVKLCSCNRTLGAYAIARLYHFIDTEGIYGEKRQKRILDCLTTMLNAPHLSSQVRALRLHLNTSDERLYLCIRGLIPRVVKVVAPSISALEVIVSTGLYGPVQFTNLSVLNPLEFPRLEKLSFPFDHDSTIISRRQVAVIRAENLVNLQCGLAFAVSALPQLPQLLSLHVQVNESDQNASDTIKAFEMKHATLRRLALIIRWERPIILSESEWTSVLREMTRPTDLPALERLSFVFWSQEYEHLGSDLFKIFLQKTPQVSSIVVHWCLTSMDSLHQWKTICPGLENANFHWGMDRWVWDSTLGTWTTRKHIDIPRVRSDLLSSNKSM